MKTENFYLYLVLVMGGVSITEAWSTMTDPIWRCCRVATSTATIAVTQFLFPFTGANAASFDDIQLPSTAIRTMPAQNDFEERLLKSLKAPTADQPQIKLRTYTMDTGTAAATKKATAEQIPVVEGLVYLANPKSETRPGPLDTLILTAESFSNPGQALAGARIPVSKAKFPMAFRMFKENALSGKEDEWLQAEDQDILVNGKICPQGTTLPCSEAESTLRAQGVAKVVRNLPGLPEGVRIRAAASLPLE